MSLAISFSAFSIFLAIAAVGFLFLLVSFVFGEIFSHDVGGHGGDVHGDVQGISFLNVRVLSVFVTAFGGFGAIGVHLGYRIEISTAIGIIGGLIFGGIIYLFARFLYGQRPRAASAWANSSAARRRLVWRFPRADWARFAVHSVKT